MIHNYFIDTATKSTTLRKAGDNGIGMLNKNMMPNNFRKIDNS
ncbi:hypothetical protein SAMN05216464_103475 [Mucilaginibacter pineti]|uniref:Uncharacterized protein n=1 Tax=Mucilaginibacter pineti TaxID=1391627 RepID=A0A1G6ZRP1_9SPHI|nr:hypothetical protein SAMN05216464_103475 [Mucilaginibacter pineti]